MSSLNNSTGVIVPIHMIPKSRIVKYMIKALTKTMDQMSNSETGLEVTIREQMESWDMFISPGSGMLRDVPVDLEEFSKTLLTNLGFKYD